MVVPKKNGKWGLQDLQGLWRRVFAVYLLGFSVQGNQMVPALEMTCKLGTYRQLRQVLSWLTSGS